MTEKKCPNVTVLVSLKIFDNVAASALYALKDRLGYNQIQSLERSDYWRLHFPDLTEKTALETVERVVSKTALFVNPNKHRWTTHLNVELGDLLPSKATETVAAVLVEEDDDSRTAGIREALLARGDCGTEVEINHGTLWVLHLGNLPHAQAQTLAEEIAVTRARQQGLLCNPHYQRATVIVP
ncbi:MAG: hypothetical protein ABIH23_12050 [bacterium]